MSNVNQIIKYSSVGMVTNIIGYILYIVFSNLMGMPPPVASILAGFMVIGISYYFNKRFTFTSQNNGVVQAMKYYLLYFSAILLHSATIFIFSSILGFAHEIVAGISLVVLSCLLFLIQKFYFFNR